MAPFHARRAHVRSSFFVAAQPTARLGSGGAMAVAKERHWTALASAHASYPSAALRDQRGSKTALPTTPVRPVTNNPDPALPLHRMQESLYTHQFLIG